MIMVRCTTFTNWLACIITLWTYFLSFVREFLDSAYVAFRPFHLVTKQRTMACRWDKQQIELNKTTCKTGNKNKPKYVTYSLIAVNNQWQQVLKSSYKILYIIELTIKHCAHRQWMVTHTCLSQKLSMVYNLGLNNSLTIVKKLGHKNVILWF